MMFSRPPRPSGPVATTRLPASRWWFNPRPAPGAAIRIWCFSPAGAGAAVWFPWATRFDEAIELVAIRLPARESRLAENPALRMDEVVAPLVAQLTPHMRPCDVFCGHSLGGLIAYETACELQRRGTASPAALIVCGTPAPHVAPTLPPVHALPLGDFIVAVEDRYGPIPREIREHREFLDLLLPALRGDLTIYETYEHSPATPLDNAILALGGEGDLVVTADEVRAWSAHTRGRFEVDFISGSHFFPQENVGPTVERVRAFLGLGNRKPIGTTPEARG